MRTTSYLFSTTPPKQVARVTGRITPFHRFRHRLPCEKIRQKSTGKELDRETGLYYFGARYLDPRTSRWLSVDPAIWQGDFLPSAPINDEARERNENLPGMGGVFNTINLHVFNYANNNPIRYVDPDGRIAIEVGFGKGGAARVRVQFQEGRLTVGIKIGIGKGGALGVSFNNETKEVGSNFFYGLEGSIGKSLGTYKTGISAEMTADSTGNRTNRASFSLAIPGTGLTIGLRARDGQVELLDPVTTSTDVIPEEFGISGMIIFGVGYEFTIDLFPSRE